MDNRLKMFFLSSDIYESPTGTVSDYQNPNFLLPLSAYPLHQEHHHHHSHLLQPQPKRHNSSGSLDLSSPYIPKLPFSDPRHEFLLRNHQQQMGFSSKCAFSSSVSSIKKFDGSSKKEGFRSGSEEISRQQRALLDQP
ncbi:hypothetical protein WN943_015872 [Citrus x changshan-huyou]